MRSTIQLREPFEENMKDNFVLSQKKRVFWNKIAYLSSANS
jgi:hypothetical protein